MKFGQIIVRLTKKIPTHSDLYCSDWKLVLEPFMTYNGNKMRSVNFYYMFTILDRLSAYLKSSKKKKKQKQKLIICGILVNFKGLELGFRCSKSYNTFPSSIDHGYIYQLAKFRNQMICSSKDIF